MHHLHTVVFFHSVKAVWCSHQNSAEVAEWGEIAEQINGLSSSSGGCMRDAFVPSNQRLKNMKLKTLLLFSMANLVPSHFPPCYVFVRLCEIPFEYSPWQMCKERWGYTPRSGCSTESRWECKQPGKGSLCEVTGVQEESGLLQGSSGSLHTARYNQLMWHCHLNSVKVGAASLAPLNRVAPREEAFKMHKRKGSEWGARRC